MKYLFSLILSVIILMFCGCEENSRPKLVMVTEATFPPYEYRSGTEIVGIDPEIVGEVAQILGYDLIIEDMSFDSVITAVQTGKADIAASGITVTEERKEKVLFTSPYVIAKQVIIIPKDSAIRGKSDLKGKRIGVQHGTTGDIFVSQTIQDPERFSNGALAVAALAAGKLDVVVLDGDPAQVHVSKRPNLTILEEPLTHEEYAFAIGKHNPELHRRFNEALDQLRKAGTLDSVREKYVSQMLDSAEENGTQLGFWSGLKNTFELNFIKDERYLYLWKGFWTTVEISFFAVILGVFIGFGIAVIRSTADQTGKLKILNVLCKIYLTVIRGTPVVVQLLIIYFVIFGAVDVNKVLVAVVAFGINSGAYVAEIIRSGIMSIDHGQLEAGRSLGLTYWQSMREIILPQAFKNVLPALGNEFIVLLKETSISGYIAIVDLTKGGDIIRSQTYDAFLPLMAVALIYLSVVMLLSGLLGRLERKLKRNE
jgi:His/Glu/Gln/Arg/opine family amino acid ABC transporter permease subunit